MKLVESFLTKNPCFGSGKKINVAGLMLHSVGCPQPKASVFINGWNKPEHNTSCVHAFIDGNDGTVYQTLPWNHRGWHSGTGAKGSANNSHIGVEMCEPACIQYTAGATFTCSNMTDAKETTKRTYDAAVELFAMLCKAHNLDPLADGVILSHKEGCYRGIASNHGDPEHLWSQLETGYTMDGFRRDVKEAMESPEESNAVAATIEVDEGCAAQQPSDKEDPKDDSDIIWEFFTEKCGLSAAATAGIMGNLYAESGLRPNNLQNTFEKKLGMDDAAYTLAVDSGAYSRESFINDKAGYGLAQWTFWSRKQALYDFAKKAGVSIGDLRMQLDFFWSEITAKKELLAKLQNTDSLMEASNAILHDYERPADQSKAVEDRRGGFGKTFYDLHSVEQDTVPESMEQPPVVEEESFSSFLVRVSTPYLNIRKGPGTNHDKIGKYTGVGTFTVVSVKEGEGSSSGWGLLKSYQEKKDGWIALSHTERV